MEAIFGGVVGVLTKVPVEAGEQLWGRVDRNPHGAHGERGEVVEGVEGEEERRHTVAEVAQRHGLGILGVLLLLLAQALRAAGVGRPQEEHVEERVAKALQDVALRQAFDEEGGRAVDGKEKDEELQDAGYH